MESDMAAYKSDFLQEIYECLDVFNQSFVDLENGDAAAIDEIFRITHTIKGMAGFLGYTSLEHLCHSMEEVLCGIKNGDIEIDGELVDILLSTVDRIMDIVKQIENADNDSVKIDDLLEAFESYEKTKDSGQEPLCILPLENKVLSPKIISMKQSEENTSTNSECLEKKENKEACNPDDCNLVLDVILANDCVMKGLRAALIIESLKDISKLAKTEPDENEMDKNFDGHFKVFLSGKSDEVERLMDRISEIEQFNISEIKPLNIDCNDETKCDYSFSDNKFNNSASYDKFDRSVLYDKFNNSVSEESQPDAPSAPAMMLETAVSSTNKLDTFHSCIYSLAARLRCILSRIIKSINCFKITESAGVLPKKKCKDSSPDGPNSQEIHVLENDSEINSAIPDQESKLDENRISEQSSKKSLDESIPGKSIPDQGIPDQGIPDKDIPDKGISDKGTSNKGISDESIPDKSIFDQELRLDKIQSLVEDSENLRIQGLKTQEVSEIGELEKDPINHFSESVTSSKEPLETKRQETIRVRTSNLDNIMNLVGELVINKGRLLQISQEYNLPELEEATGTLDKSISSLQDEVMRIRMVKIERVFSKFPRMVRDLSRKFNKNIEFEIEGQDTELDRTILDEISDPLVHLVRNAVDHGVEYPDERKKAGKSEVGHIKLSARREKNNVIIEIEDDGKGIDVEVLKKKAVEKGLLSLFDVENLSEEEIRMIIFAPGFSTKDSPTEISGRGVGMDAVKTAVEKLGGKVRVYSKKGEFARIRIDLPPTVAIIKSLLVEVGSETYAIPIANVVKALSVDSSDYKLVKETPVLYIRDKLIPTVGLKELFNVGCDKLDKEIAIIVEKENEEIGLIVDSIIDQQEIVIKPLGNTFSNSKGFIGATILGDGRVIPIIDVSMLIKGDIDD
ncbi:chemotaxis protein CheA [Methanosarcina sp.]|uniref:chemotaxis protein CheA n=1 Tax=Methanosarcina sp. TaxID=2213 RepID=UPI002ABAB651|nr:chemotaxis protein CheA [Methanosarcina sp.]MDY9924972.1 chemotaxis protein CheA [Methanosarcina sp.]